MGEALPTHDDGSASPLQIGIALKKTFRDGYRWKDLRADLVAGVIVGIVALPLSMALAIASGVPPQHGLYTAIVAGAVIAVLGGSRVQVSGPTAAFVVLLAPISAKYGLGGLLLATHMAGVLLLVMGAARLGRLIEFVPYPVTMGFTAGIGTVIATLQVKDLLGLETGPLPEHFLEKVAVLARAVPTARWEELVIGLLTLGLLVLWPRVTRKIPAPLVALGTAGIIAAALGRLVPGFTVATIDSRFTYMLDGVERHGIPRVLPPFHLPWEFPGPDGKAVGFDLDLMRELAPSAFAIAMLGAIESLLSAVVADGMIRRRHDPDVELIAQGAGNLVSPFLGGISATGAIARTATNIRSGGRSPFAAIFHSVFVLLAVLLLAPLLGHLPMSSLAALLLLVAWNMSDAHQIVRTARTAPRSDILVLAACFGLTVVFDMVVSVTAGVMLAALLFMRRMAMVSDVSLVADPHRVLKQELPKATVLYEVVGPLFFGAARRAMAALNRVDHTVKVVILDIRSVPIIDATGLVNLESAVGRLLDGGTSVEEGIERARAYAGG
ncbi:MAG: C4-dicarboxylic acid transporter DauA [Planctomycetes bacterium]|nr:C4-dicarboxylic acid transporter DauA [Planctomycetota bacterium]